MLALPLPDASRNGERDVTMTALQIRMARRFTRALMLWCAGLGMGLAPSIGFAQASPVQDSIAVVSMEADTSASAAASDADSVAPDLPTNARIMVRSKRVALVGKGDHVVRTGPGDAYAIAGLFDEGEDFLVLAKNGDWYGVKLSETQTGWVHSSLCKELDDLAGLEFKPNPKVYSRTGAYVLSGYAGAYAYDRKSNSLVAGGRLGYYVFDRLQAEAGVAWTHVQRPAEIVESLFGVSLEAEDFQMLFYNMNLTYEVLPGRQMVPFVTAGVGSTIMLGRSEYSFNYGAGTTLFLSRRSAMRWEVRAYEFDSGSPNARVKNHNIEFSLGTQILF